MLILNNIRVFSAFHIVGIVLLLLMVIGIVTLVQSDRAAVINNRVKSSQSYNKKKGDNLQLGKSDYNQVLICIPLPGGREICF
ncbi:MAG: hypothetical protein AB1489_41890 [Acidobacteriota bacterium]